MKDYFKVFNNTSTFLKIVFNYFCSISLLILIWNILIGSFIYNKTSSNADNLGYGREPNSTFVSGLEGYAKYKLDNFGYNNNYISKKSDKYRIIIIGNSISESMEVMRQKTLLA